MLSMVARVGSFLVVICGWLWFGAVVVYFCLFINSVVIAAYLVGCLMPLLFV